ncbi:MAG: hypothetical protein IK126_12035, partial [Bacteroidales bacterium]|nr:hypothetical protein [Bacteroidales bacterium]
TYYKRVDDEGFRQLALEPMIVDRVKEYRNDNPRLGSVKLWLMLKRQFEDTGCFPGRDAFIELLRRHGLMAKRKYAPKPSVTHGNYALENPSFIFAPKSCIRLLLFQEKELNKVKILQQIAPCVS